MLGLWALVMMSAVASAAEGEAPRLGPRVGAVHDAATPREALEQAGALVARARARDRVALEWELRRMAQAYWAQGKDPRDPAMLEHSVQASRLYLAAFPSDPNGYEVRYGLGEVLYALRRYDEALNEFEAVVALDPHGPRSKYCANSAIHAADKLHDEVVAAPWSTSKGYTGPVPLGPEAQRLRAALERYVALYPDDRDAGFARYKLAYLLYVYGHFADAEPIFLDVIERAPGSRDAMNAANLLVDSLVLLQDWPAAYAAALEYAQREDLGNASFHEEMADVAERIRAVKLGLPPG